MAVISLTTDFGLSDNYVGLMKGVILSVCPGATVVDVTHGVPAQNVVAGALAIERLPLDFPAGSVHVVVVDPGVGTARRPVAVQVGAHVFVGPDNGVFSLVLPAQEAAVQAVVLDRPVFHRPRVSATFHGRDVFSPVAAHLAAGVLLRAVGSAAGGLKRLALPEPEGLTSGETTLRLTVLDVDYFGNLITNLRQQAFETWQRDGRISTVQIEAGGVSCGHLRHTFGEVPEGALVAYWGSTGRLEIAERNGSATRRLGLGRGDAVVIRGGP